MVLRCVISLLLVATSWVTAEATDLQPTLGQRGTLLLNETFSEASLPDHWTRNAGTLSVTDGVLRVSELAADKHVAACRYPLPVQNCAVQFDFQLDGAKLLHFGYDPAPGELQTHGHLFSVAVTPTSWSLLEHVTKKGAIAEAPLTLEPARWYTLLVECRGDQVVAQIAGQPPLKGHAPDFHVKKPGLVFRAGSAEDQPVLIDNLRVWELK
jgi:hypothetical protein